MKNLKHWFRLTWLILLVAIGAKIGVLVNESQQTDRHVNNDHRLSTMIGNPLPETITELVTSSDVIVVGRVGKIVNQEIVYGYGLEAEKLAELDKQTSAQLGLPMIDYEIFIDEVMLGDFNTQKNEPLLYRIPGAHDTEMRDENLMKLGDTKLLFLSASPNGKTYGITSFMHMMNIEDSSITYDYEGRNIVAFGAGNSSDFLDQVRNVVLAQK